MAAAARDALESGGLLLIADERGALVVPELLRLLLDERGLGWDEAWNAVSGATFARLGCPKNEPARPFWTAEFLEAEQPRLLEILYEVNRRHLEEVEARWPRRRRAPAAALALPRGATTKRLRTGILAVLASRRADVATPWEGPIGAALGDLAVLRSRALHARPTPVFARVMDRRGQPRAGLAADRGAGRRLAERPGAAPRPHSRSAPSTPGSARPSRPPAAPPARRLSALLQARGFAALDPGSLVDVRLCDETPHGRTVAQRARGGARAPAAHAPAAGRRPPRARWCWPGPSSPGLRRWWRPSRTRSRTTSRARPWLRVVVLPDCDSETRRVAAAAADLSNQPGAAGSGAAGTRALALAMGGALTLGTLNGSVRELQHAVGAREPVPVRPRSRRDARLARGPCLPAAGRLRARSAGAARGRQRCSRSRYPPDGSAFVWLKPELLDPRRPVAGARRFRRLRAPAGRRARGVRAPDSVSREADRHDRAGPPFLGREPRPGA